MTSRRSLGRHLVAWGLALGLGFVSGLGWLLRPHAPNLDPLIVVVLWFNLVVILLALGVEIGRRPYSLHLMHLLALFLFLGVASLLQYSGGRFGVAGSIGGVRGQILPATATATLWIAGYLVSYEGWGLLGRARRSGFVARFLTRGITPLRAFVLACGGLLAFAYLAALGLAGAGTRGAADVAVEEFSLGAGAGRFTNAFYIINYNLPRTLPLVALLAALLVMGREIRGGRLVLIPAAILLGIGTLVLNNPFAASRMYLTTTVFGFAAPFLLRRFKTGGALVLAVLAGLTVLPALSATRNTLTLEEFRTSGYFSLASPIEYLATNSDVDSLGMTALCQKWIDRHGHRYGRQILGALLAWFPRTLWHGKPIGTGAMVTRDLGFDFTNLSPPISAEALVDFGLIGVPLLGALFGLILARLDSCYWAPGREALGASPRVIDAIYPFWLVCIVFFTRGDLFAALTHMEGFTFWVLPLGIGLAATQRASAHPGGGWAPAAGPRGNASA